MNDIDLIQVAFYSTCVAISIPGIVVALKKDAWYGVSVNSTIYVFFGIIVTWQPLLQNYGDYGQLTPDDPGAHEVRWNLIGVIFLGGYWMVFQLIAIPLAALMRRRRARKAKG